MASSEKDILGRVEKMAGPLGRGLVGQFLPSICSGIMEEYVGKIEIGTLVNYVKKNASLWQLLPPDTQTRARNIMKGIAGKQLDWFTADWAIEAVRDDHPAQASLFLGWPAAYIWLVEQATEIKQEILRDA